MNKQRVITTSILVFVGFLLIIFLSSGTFTTIEAGQRGVIFRPFGSGLDKENLFNPGFHIVAPWNSMYIYDVREHSQEEQMEVLSANGLTIKLDITVRVHPKYNSIGDLHEQFGKEYLNTLVRPEVRSSVRKVIGKFTEEQLYSTKRDTVQALIRSDIEQALGRNYIELREALIRDIVLPAKVRDAIEDKLEAEQAALKYEYLLQRELLEAQRRVTEARGKAESNQILNASLTDKILTDKGIEATLELANSPNSKVIIVGSGDKGLPMILGGN